MSLAAGTRLGPYEIQAAIGAGGMGEVYKAHDTRLDRTVAIKVLPAHVSADPERRARFEREAKTIAGLNHPHICTLHDVGESEGSTFLVMEHLTGETLAQRLEKGRLPLEQALTVATEIADALAAAHRQGVVHRDLKPGNVMLTKAGAKLLDFGLAKLKGHGEQPAAAHLASAPTQSTPLTGEGMIVGTLQYMGPEQLEGKPADARTDLWALGAILYEMVTGKRAFEGTSAASLITAIMSVEPAPVSTLQPLTPPALDRLVRQCLAKSPEDRPDTAHDVANDLRWLRESSAVSAVSGVPSRRRRWRTLVPIAIVGVVTALVGAGLMRLLGPSRAPAPAVTRTSLDVRPAEELNALGYYPTLAEPTPGGTRTAFAWTPDGRTLVFIGRRADTEQIYLRPLDRGEASPLAGTEGARALAVSADGQWVAFWAKGTLKKAPLAGGLAVEIAALPSIPFGLAWDTRGNLYIGRADRRICRVPPAGGLDVVSVDDDYTRGVGGHILPSVLPNGKVLLYTLRKRPHIGWGDEEIVAQVLATGERKPLLKDAADARYVHTGHLVFLRRATLFGVAFDPERVEIRGTPVPLLDGVSQALIAPHHTSDATGAGQFAVASTGTLAWVPGPVPTYADTALVWVDRRGTVSPVGAPPHSYGRVAELSPDGQRVAVGIQTLAGERAWVYDLTRTTLSIVNPDAEVSWEKWSHDGQRLVFRLLSKARMSLAWQRIDAAGPLEVLTAEAPFPCSWTSNGRQLGGVLGGDMVVVTIENGQAPRLEALARTPAAEGCPEFSPDGRWLAYHSNVTGRSEIYIQPYPSPGPRQQVSIDGGICPAWGRDGHELFFLSSLDAAGKRRMMVADFAPAPQPRVSAPRPLFDFRDAELAFNANPRRGYDVSADGRFLVTRSFRTPPPAPVTHINLIQNWHEELKVKVPTGR